MTTPGQARVAEAAERSHLALRRAVVDVAMSLVRAGVLSHSGHADLSARVGPDAVLIATLNRTGDLVPDDLAVIRLDGTVAEGDPGVMDTEVVAMHTEVYRARPQAGAVIHTHSPHLLAFALAAAAAGPVQTAAPPGPGGGGPRGALGERRHRADRGTTGHAGHPAGRPRGARLRPGRRDDGLAPGRARGGGGGRTAHRRPRPVIRAARGTLPIWGDRGHHRHRHPVPGLREGWILQRPGGCQAGRWTPEPGPQSTMAICRSLCNGAGWSWRNSVTLAPVSHRRRTARRSSSTSPPHTPCAPIPNACRIDSSRQSGRTGQRAQTAMACAAWSRALATPRASGNQSSGSTREPAHRASWYTRPGQFTVGQAMWLTPHVAQPRDHQHLAAPPALRPACPSIVFGAATAPHPQSS